MAKRIIGLDIGTYSVKVATIESPSRPHDFAVVQYLQKVLPVSPVVEDPSAQLLERQEATLKALKDEGAFSVGTFAAAISGLNTQIRILKLPFSDEKKIQAVIGGELDAQIPFDLEEIKYLWTPVVAHPPSETEAEGFEVLVAFAKKTALLEDLEMLKRLEIDPRWVFPKAASNFELFQHVLRKMPTFSGEITDGGGQFAVVDIGHTQTSICVSTLENLLLARTVLRGGFDATRLLAQRLRIPLEDAEKKKCAGAFIEIDEDKGKLLDDHLTSEAIREAYSPILREIRQTALAARSHEDGKLRGIFLVGGGSRVRNLDRFFSAGLQVPVFQIGELEIAEKKIPCEYAAAISYAASGQLPSKKQSKLNFREGDFAWRGELDYLRAKAVPLSIGLFSILFLFATYILVQNYFLSLRARDTEQKALKICAEILSQKPASPTQCLSIMRQQINGGALSPLPKRSAVDVYLEFAKSIPSNAQIKVTEMDITGKSARISGETPSFDNIDTIVDGLSTGRCFTNIDKGRARQIAQGVGFQISLDLNCEAKPEELRAPQETMTKAKEKN